MSELTVKDTEARKRLLSLFDEGTFTELDAFAKSADGEIEVVAGMLFHRILLLTAEQSALLSVLK